MEFIISQSVYRFIFHYFSKIMQFFNLLKCSRKSQKTGAKRGPRRRMEKKLNTHMDRRTGSTTTAKTSSHHNQKIHARVTRGPEKAWRTKKLKTELKKSSGKV